MFSNLFRKKQPYKKIETPANGVRFLGAPGGDGVKILEAELTALLRAEGNTVAAYISKIEHPNEEKIRLALIIENKDSASVAEMASTIACGCQPVVDIDIVFLSSFSSQVVQQVLELVAPFYVAEDA